MAEKLEILITAKDEASKVFDKLGGVLSGGLKMGLGLATAGVGLLGTGLGIAVSEAMEAEVNIKKLEAVIKSTGGVAGITSEEAQKFADSLSTVTRFSDDAILKSETMLLTFTNIGEDIFPRVTEATLDMAEMFGGDASQAAITLGKAMNDPFNGATALERIGIKLNEQQKAQLAAMQEVNDVSGAQALILGEVEREMGGVARAAGDTLGGKLTILKNRLLNSAEAAGTYLLPYLEDLADTITAKLGPFVENLAFQFGNLLEVFQRGDWYGFGEVLGNILGNTQSSNDVAFALVDAFHQIYDGLTELVGWTTTAVRTMIDAFKLGGWEGVSRVVLDNLRAGLGDLGQWALDNLALPLMQKVLAVDWGQVAESGKALLEKIGDGLSDLTAWAETHLVTPLVAKLLAVDWAGVQETGKALLEKIGDGLSDLTAWAETHLVTPLVAKLLAVDWAGVQETGKNILQKIQDGLGDLGQWALDNLIIPLAEKIFVAVDNPDVWGNLGETAGKVLKGMAEGFMDLANWAYDNVIKPLVDGLFGGTDKPESQEGLHNTSKSTLEKLAEGFMDIANWAYDTVLKPFVEGLLTGILGTDYQAKLMQFAGDLLVGIASGLGDLVAWAKLHIIDPILDAIKDLPGDITDYIGDNLPGPLKSLVGRQLGGLAEPGGNYRVNELGGEGFMPVQRGVVIPHDIYRALQRQSVQNTWNMNIHTNAPYEPIAADFQLMQAWAGG